MSEIIWIGNVCPTKTRDNPNQGRVYSVDGIAPALHTCQGGNLQPMVVVMDKEYTVCEQRTDEGLRLFNDDVVGTIRTINAGVINE